MNDAEGDTPQGGSLLDEAFAHVVRLSSGEATRDDAERLARWRAQGPAHEAAWRDATRIWRLSRAAAVAPAGRAPARHSRRRLLAGAALAAGAAGVSVVGTRLGYWPGPREWLADHRTATGERRSVRLADGSMVELNTRTSLAVRFTGDRRHVRLIGGEAVFSTRPVPGRPFEVEAADGITTADGQAVFAIRRAGDDRVAVTGLDGTVGVWRTETARLGPGQRVRYGPDGLERPEPVDAEGIVAWRRGLLVFRDEPLARVVAELNRYRAGYIHLSDPRLLDRRVSGVFHVARPQEILDHLAGTLALQVRRLPAGIVLLS
ncbi:sensor [Allostella vacuolata]|nr:sensor [Stella vacuolata]